jgi:hypothetical protein
MATEPATGHLQLSAAEGVGMSLLRHCFWFIMKSNEQSDQLVVLTIPDRWCSRVAKATAKKKKNLMDHENGDA